MEEEKKFDVDFESLLPLRGANFSLDRKYRWSLWRIWDAEKAKCMFIGLNPSTANEKDDDATIRRVKRFANDFGFGGVYMMNLFPLVSTDPRALAGTQVEQSFDNNLAHIEFIARWLCKEVFFAWGSFSIINETQADREVIKMFPQAKCLGLNKDGTPKHPCRLRADLRPEFFNKNARNE